MSNKIEPVVSVLEKEKLELEIKILSRNMKFRTDFFKALLPTILAILSLLYAFGSGFFEVKSESLRIEQHQLQMEIAQFEETKKELLQVNQSLRNQQILLIDSLRGQSENLSLYEKNLISEQEQSDHLREQIQNLVKTRQNLNNQILELENIKRDYSKELFIKYFEEADYDEIISAQRDTINNLKGKIMEFQNK